MCHKIYMGNTRASFESPAEPAGCTSTADIEDEIALLSATIAAATYRLLCLIGELDRRDAWAKGGPTVLANLASLCKRHHTFVHEGGFRMEPLPDGRFRFLRPDGRELFSSPALPEVNGDARKNLALRWVKPDVKLTPDTGYPEWDGEPVDYDWVLGWHEPPGARP